MLFKDLCENCREQRLNEAKSILRQDYYKDVNDIADMVKDAIKNKEFDSADGLQRYLDESIDGSSRVIYNGEAELGLWASENSDAHEDMGSENPTINERMYFALRQDVMEHLDGIDMNKPFKCAECESEFETADEAVECCKKEEVNS